MFRSQYQTVHRGIVSDVLLLTDNGIYSLIFNVLVNYEYHAMTYFCSFQMAGWLNSMGF